MKQLRDATLETLDQVKDLIMCLPNDTYSQSTAYNKSSIGCHIRHILDHFLAFKTGIANGCIDYNQRNRESQIEKKPELAIELIDNIALWVEHNPFEDGQIYIESEISISEQKNLKMASYISREYCYLISHTFHHLAYASLVAKSMGVPIPEQIGIAPGTATYMRLTESAK